MKQRHLKKQHFDRFRSKIRTLASMRQWRVGQVTDEAQHGLGVEAFCAELLSQTS
jgi:hypothetical protein